MEHYWQITQIARFLEKPESSVRALILSGELPAIKRRGLRGAYLVAYSDVKHYAIRENLGKTGRRERLVLLVGGDELDEAELALYVSGLTTERAPSILAAITQHDIAGAPIIVISGNAARREIETLRERGVLEELSKMMFLACVSPSVTGVPWAIDRQSLVCDPWEHRRLVIWAWQALENRHRVGAPDLLL